MVQVSPDVGRQFRGGVVSPRPLLLERLHGDPVQVAAQLGAQGVRIGPATAGYLG